MLELGEDDKRLLELIQQDLPLTCNPFLELGRTIGLDEPSTISSIKRLKEKEYIRDISAIFYASALNYKSTLVALSTDSPEKTAIAINKHSGVSHNYLRENPYNIWFTITIPDEMDFKTVIDKILENEDYQKYRILPALKTYKIGVNFRFTDIPGERKVEQHHSSCSGQKIDKNLIRILQEPFPLTERPWRCIAEKTGIDEKELMSKLKEMKQNSIIKRISGVLRHRNVGYKANGMACFIIKENKIDQVGQKVATFDAVSHCYRRPTYKDWPYSLFAMTHGHNKEECDLMIKAISKELGSYEYLALYSTKEYKKERVKYFLEEINV